jgi:hypothetical protein
MHNSSTHDNDDDGSQLLPSQVPLGEPPPLLMLLLLSSPYYWACGANFDKDSEKKEEKN